MSRPVVDVIIPTYRPDRRFLKLLHALAVQTYPAEHVIVMNTDRAVWKETFGDKDLRADYPFLRIYHVTKEAFDHAATRAAAVAKSDADYFLMMTQDAVPADAHLVERLVAALEETDLAAAAYARQLPRKKAAPEEALERSFQYPAVSRTQTKEDVERIGIKAYYCPNVCALYKREIYDRLGGFAGKAVFNEDVVYAATAIKAGYAIRYAADARVIHSHGYTCMQGLHRNFDQGVSEAMHPEIFQEIPPASEGMRLVRFCIRGLVRQGKAYRIPYFVLKCAFRYTGFFLGMHYRALPVPLCRVLAMNKGFFGAT